MIEIVISLYIYQNKFLRISILYSISAPHETSDEEETVMFMDKDTL